MRTSMVGATFLLVAAGAALAGAPALNGSDTLFDVTNDVLGSCATKFDGVIETPSFGGFSITYAGGGSGVGEAQMKSNVQHIAPMSRAMNSSALCAVNGGTTSEGLEVGLDGIAISANPTSTCSSGGVGNGVATGGSFTVNPGGTTYTIASSLDVLRLVYFGIDHNNVADCNSATRRSLVATWNNLFTTPCAAGTTSCGAGLRHAFRRSDLSGTTDAFVTLVGVGSTGRGVGNNPFATGAVISKKTNPFCNSYDANTSTPAVTLANGGVLPTTGPAWPVCSASVPCPQNFACDFSGTGAAAGSGKCTFSANNVTPAPCSATVLCPDGWTCNTGTSLCDKSDGGRSDFTDYDPIRITCALPSSSPAGFDEICDVSGKLGLVLPVFLPDVAAVTTTDDYPTIDCDAGFCDLVAPARVTQMPVGYLCPDGQVPSLNRCFMPYHVDTTLPGGENFACRSDKRLNHCFPFTSASAEGRMYNKAIIKPNSNPGQGANALDLNNRIMSGAFFRLRAGLNSGTTPADPSPCLGSTNNDDTSLIGCLTTSDPCSIGFAGREAAPVGSGKALSVNSIYPNDANIVALVDNSGTAIYPLARRLYLATMYGFGPTLAGLSFGGGAAGGEAEVAKCFGDNFIDKSAIVGHHFVPNPAGVTCLDYDETNTTTAISDVTKLIPGTCGATSNINACTTAATAPEIGPTAQNVFNILSKTTHPCGSCHTGGGSTLPQSMDLTTLAAFEAAMVNVNSTQVPAQKLVNPGNSAASYLIVKLNPSPPVGVQMPANGPPFLTSAQVGEIAAWIDDGAPL